MLQFNPTVVLASEVSLGAANTKMVMEEQKSGEK